MNVIQFMLEAQRETERHLKMKLQPRYSAWEDVPSYSDRTIRLGAAIAAIEAGYATDLRNDVAVSVLLGKKRVSPIELGGLVAHFTGRWGEAPRKVRAAEHLLRYIELSCIESDHEQRRSRDLEASDYTFHGYHELHNSVVRSPLRLGALAPILRLDLKSDSEHVWAIMAYVRCTQQRSRRQSTICGRRALDLHEIRECAWIVSEIFSATIDDGNYEPPKP